MSQSPWEVVEAELRKSPNPRATLNGYNTLTEKHVFNKPFETIPHAILDTDKRVVMIRSYPRKAKSNSVVAITEDTGPCGVGWVWDGKTFNREGITQDA